jgi:signal transduction histidine kinase
VRVDGGGSALCVEVRNGHGRANGRATSAVGGGHGLVGMRERVRAYGGSLEAAPTADGFLVRARLPLVLEAAP